MYCHMPFLCLSPQLPGSADDTVSPEGAFWALQRGDKSCSVFRLVLIQMVSPTEFNGKSFQWVTRL